MPSDVESPVYETWWLADEKGGRVQLEMSLSPESPARVQALNVTSVPAPSAALADLANGVIAAINAVQPTIPEGLELGPDVDREALGRALRIAAARYAPVALGPVVAGDGTGTATWRLSGSSGRLELSLTRDVGSVLVTAISLRPFLAPPPSQGD
jgi:hypothetical protein